MSPEIEVKPPELRSKFAFLFGCIAELYSFHYGNKPDTKVENVKQALEELKSDERISDYLYSNIIAVMDKYPELMPGKFQTKEFMEKLRDSLTMVIADICEELSDLNEGYVQHERESLVTWLNGGRKN